MRNGKIIAWAGLSGMLSGFGQALQQSQTTQSISPLGATSSVDPTRAVKYGAAAGVGTAMAKLSDYYIKRADQYHPIIEVGAGNVATVVFQRGFSLKDSDKSKHKFSEDIKSPEQKAQAIIPASVLNQISNSHLGQTINQYGAH